MKIQMKFKYTPTIVYWGSVACISIASFCASPPPDVPWWAIIGGSMVASIIVWLNYHLFIVTPIVVFSGRYNSRLNRVHKHH